VRVFTGTTDRGPVLAAAVVIGALAVQILTVFLGFPLLEVTIVIALAIGAALGSKWALQWKTLLALTFLVILLIPIRRYRLPGDLPFELEPYRLIVAFVIAGWVTSLLIDRRVQLRLSGFEGPLLLFAFAALVSVIVNDERIRTLGVQPEVIKRLTFFLSFLLVFYLIVSVVRHIETIDYLVKVVVGIGAVVASFAVIESRTGYNPFNDLSTVIPFLERDYFGDIPNRGARFRAFGPAQHPIALGAVLAMILPLGIYLGRWYGRRWWIAVGLLALGALGTVSRTSVIMLAVICLVFLWLRPRQTKRFWPLLIPVALVVQFALPGTIETLRDSFSPPGGLVAEQAAHPDQRGSGRIADLGPSLSEFSRQPLVGQGFGTRVAEAGRANARILDNQWLKTLLETGVVGAFAWGWLFFGFIRRAGRAAKEDPGQRGWLLVALTGSTMAYAVSMLFYDAFSFIQVTFVLFILLALGSVLLADPRSPRRERV
jgi:O-antigen ligase